MLRYEIYDAIEKEREYQVQKWGSDFDDKNTPNDWITYIAKYLGQAVTLPWNPGVFRGAILKVAALCVAILERETYPKRHYD